MSKLARVLFYMENEDHQTFTRIGISPVVSPAIALEIYANTPNPASQMIQADNITQLWVEVLDMDNKMADPKYTKEYIWPYL